MRTREEYNEWQREKRKANGNLYTNRYEKTINGFLVRKYRNMQSRVCGVQKLKSHLYKGLSLLPREVFYQWALASEDFKKLWQVWVDNKYQRNLCPTVDRIDSHLGYELSNMRWLTHGENSRLGNLSKRKKI